LFPTLQEEDEFIKSLFQKILWGKILITFSFFTFSLSGWRRGLSEILSQNVNKSGENFFHGEKIREYFLEKIFQTN